MNLLLRVLLLIIYTETLFVMASGPAEIYLIVEEIDLREGFRQMNLAEDVSKHIADMIVKKNVSILIEFQQREHSQGNFFAVYAGRTKVLEIVIDGMRAESLIRWSRGTSLSKVIISNVEFDDEQWHTVIFEIQGTYARLYKSCMPILEDEYPELDFSALNKTKPVIWITQASSMGGQLLGKIRQFKVKQGSFLREMCNPNQLPSVQYLTSNDIDEDQHHMINLKVENDQLKKKLENLENQLEKLTQTVRNHIINNSNRPSPDNSTAEPDPTLGVCPNCYEYLRHKTNYLETEFKRWRESIQTMENSVKHVILAQRGCIVDGTRLADGHTWETGTCNRCTCHGSKVQCHPVGCKPLNCSFPLKKADQCCPACGRDCFYMQKWYHHGQIFYPKSCVKCQCLDGETFCQHETHDVCPQLQCPDAQRVSLENRCCPICVDYDFCASNPCHPSATCTNKKYGHECVCKAGYFGDGQVHCFDVDECRSTSPIYSNNTSGSGAIKPMATNGLPSRSADDYQAKVNSNGPCGAGSRCINTPGSFHCKCLPGHTKISDMVCFDHVSKVK